jgi:hypothetical protein
MPPKVEHIDAHRLALPLAREGLQAHALAIAIVLVVACALPLLLPNYRIQTLIHSRWNYSIVRSGLRRAIAMSYTMPWAVSPSFKRSGTRTSLA